MNGNPKATLKYAANINILSMVERIIQQIKTFHILDGEIRMTMKNVADQIFFVCAL
jgi:hypothetical protein